MNIIPKFLQRRLNRNLYYREVFASPQGQAVLADILRACGVGREVHVPGDPHTTAYNAGLRRAALGIISKLEMDDAAAMRMAMQEPDDEQ